MTRADDVRRLDDLIADDQHDVARAVVVIALRLPMDCRELGIMRPSIGPLYRDACLLQHIDEFEQILLGFLKDLLAIRSARNIRDGAVGELGHLGAAVGVGEAGIQRIAHNDLLQRVPLVPAPYA